MLILIFSGILLIVSCYFFIKTKNIKTNILQQKIKILNFQNQITNLKKEWQQWQVAKASLQDLIKKQQLKYKQLKQQNELKQQEEKNKTNSLKQIYIDLENEYKKGYINFVKILDNAYIQKEKEFQLKQHKINQNISQLQSELNAIAAEKRREEEIQNNINFYKIQITEKQKKDIQLLQQWKKQLNDPSLVSKIIWSSCIMKPTGDLCNRLTQGKTICGIYKITSLKSSKCYIGQSVNITDRFKQHIKCGLGIDAPATNKMYNLMQQQGVYNFTFEIIQTCSKEKLNERQRFWIQTFESDKFGMNSTGGNKK